MNKEEQDIQPTKVTFLYKRKDDVEETISDDPLEDLFNEFGTETDYEPEVDEDENNDLSELNKIEYKKLDDYFYSTKFPQTDFEDDLEELEHLLEKSTYLAKKLKYYNEFLLNK